MRKGAIRSPSMGGSMKKIYLYDIQLTFYRVNVPVVVTLIVSVYNKYRAELQYITPYINNLYTTN